MIFGKNSETGVSIRGPLSFFLNLVHSSAFTPVAIVLFQILYYVDKERYEYWKFSNLEILDIG